MANFISTNTALLSSGLTTAAMISTNPIIDFAFTASSSAVAIEYNPSAALSASLVGVAMSAGGIALLSALSSFNAAFISYTFANTAGTVATNLSSGTGTIIVDRTYIGAQVNIRVADRSGFLANLPTVTGVLSLTANDRNAWGAENARMHSLGYY